jgi:hypothetical protein
MRLDAEFAVGTVGLNLPARAGLVEGLRWAGPRGWSGGLRGDCSTVVEAVAAFTKADIQAVLLPVSHAFHTRIVAPASEPLRLTLERLHIEPPRLPVVANVTGDFYAMDPAARRRILEVLVSRWLPPCSS